MKYHLSDIEEKYYDSIKEYRKELLEASSTFNGCHLLKDYEDIYSWHQQNLLYENISSLPDGNTRQFQFIYVNDNSEVLAMANIRPDALNDDYYCQYGGYVGYNVRPSYRHRGIASKMYEEILKICKDRFKLDKILITSNRNNEASKRIIKKYGGVYEGAIIYPPTGNVVERYWLEL